MKVVLVDTDHGWHKAVQDHLEFFLPQVEVISFTDGYEAFLWMEAHDFDAVILEVMLPSMNGWQITQSLKATKPGCLVFTLTSVGSSLNTMTAGLYGADGAYDKPNFSSAMNTICLRLQRGLSL